jgi:hypothetical protein
MHGYDRIDDDYRSLTGDLIMPLEIWKVTTYSKSNIMVTTSENYFLTRENAQEYFDAIKSDNHTMLCPVMVR